MITIRTFLLFALSLSVMLATSCGGETVVTKVDPNSVKPQSSEGVIFSLPETLVVTEVPLTKSSAKPGIYHNWTGFFYPEYTTNEYVTEETTAFKVGAPTFTTRGQTDPNNIYIAHIKAKQFETKTLLLEFNEDGIIARTEASSKDESIDILTSTIKTVASIAAPLLPLPARADLNVNAVTIGDVNDCQGMRVDAQEASAEAIRAAVKSAAHPRSRAFKAAASKALKEAQEAAARAEGCYEKQFKRALSPREAALYESLADDYVKFLRQNFGFDYLLYIVRTGDVDESSRAASVEFFLTLNPKQQKFINDQARSTVPCIDAPAATKCLAASVKTELIKAKAIYDKIQKLRQQRESLLAEEAAAQVNTSAHLEFRLKELDAQIKATEATYFLGTSSESSATARFEFKPTTAAMGAPLFKYSAGGSDPGICKGSVPADNPGVFKAIWPRKFEGTCRTANSLFEVEDFRDLKQFASRLKTAAAAPAPPADLVSAYLYSQLALPTQALVNGPLDTPQQKAALAAALKSDLNTLVTAGSIYSAAMFINEKLSSDTIKLINTAVLSPAQVVELNRLLIEDTYRQEIYRQVSWVEHQISVAVNATPPGLASQVSLAMANNKLTESGKRGFPYRIAPTTLAKLFDDNVEKGRGEVRIAQFGPVQTLPGNLGGRRSSYKITYYDASGAIKLFDMSADALIQKQNVTDLTDAAISLRDSETAKLKRETDLLKARKDKLEAEKALLEAEKNLRTAQATPTPTPSP